MFPTPRYGEYMARGGLRLISSRLVTTSTPITAKPSAAKAGRNIGFLCKDVVPAPNGNIPREIFLVAYSELNRACSTGQPDPRQFQFGFGKEAHLSLPHASEDKHQRFFPPARVADDRDFFDIGIVLERLFGNVRLKPGAPT